MADSEFQIEAMGLIYAQALFNLAKQQNIVDEITEDVRGIGAAMSANPQLTAFFEAPMVTEEEKERAVDKIFTGRVNMLTLQVLKSMGRRDRLMFSGGLVKAWEDLLARLANRVDVELVSAQALSPEAMERIKAAVGKALGKVPDFATRIDPTLLGGLKLRVGDTMIDASVETQLQKIKTQLQRTGLTALQKRMDAITAA